MARFTSEEQYDIVGCFPSPSRHFFKFEERANNSVTDKNKVEREIAQNRSSAECSTLSWRV
jgi:hypothetical protein